MIDIATIIGTVDVYQAAVAIATGAGATIVVTTALARTPRKKLEMDFELAKIRQQLDHESRTQELDNGYRKNIAQMSANKEVEFKRIESGMIDVAEAKRKSQYDNG